MAARRQRKYVYGIEPQRHLVLHSSTSNSVISRSASPGGTTDPVRFHTPQRDGPRRNEIPLCSGGSCIRRASARSVGVLCDPCSFDGPSTCRPPGRSSQRRYASCRPTLRRVGRSAAVGSPTSWTTRGKRAVTSVRAAGGGEGGHRWSAHQSS